MGRRSSVREDFVHVKTVVGLERFEVGKSRRSYEVPFSRGGGSQKLLQIGLTLRTLFTYRSFDARKIPS